MKLTPLEIKKQNFKSRVRGYDAAEVGTFLEMVADEFEIIQNEKNELRAEVEKHKVQLKDYQEVEKNLQETLMNAQESVRQSRENSKREAKILVREAELKAEKILDEAREQLDKMKNELSILRSQKESFAKRLKYLLKSQIELIDVLKMDDVQIKEFTSIMNNQEKIKKGKNDNYLYQKMINCSSWDLLIR